MHRNSISLCMIVRDAEETVGRAIKSALAVVDEVVVVDTGSADNTRLIVEGYGARVVEHDWNDDFAAARNAGIEAATGSWIHESAGLITFTLECGLLIGLGSFVGGQLEGGRAGGPQPA